MSVSAAIRPQSPEQQPYVQPRFEIINGGRSASVTDPKAELVEFHDGTETPVTEPRPEPDNSHPQSRHTSRESLQAQEALARQVALEVVRAKIVALNTDALDTYLASQGALVDGANPVLSAIRSGQTNAAELSM